ncbi:nucleoside-diphosphate-sugar epimerase family protein [Lasiosphaeris hirsuta]|uniref:Nucleoside-diphosphate-sugar epimerase family protein n=1 Tax=Lasiosphaeris hirsuta TaxID=260670 RepID=A0AA40E7B9_9PEZI|nr:nucleoside-diphosphate-sugar epimerase family protein [Lasiosphaeris hirsuta]
MAPRKILVVGATGQQGQATIAALQQSRAREPAVEILGLTRSASSPKADALKKKFPNVTLVEGDTRAPGPVFDAHPDIQSIFLVTAPPEEELQALPLIDAACSGASKVDHIVFSSVDRGGDDISWSTPTPVQHFAAKHGIELYLRDACEKSARGIRWTILRPTGFMDNYNPGSFGSLMASLWANGMPADQKMQLVSAHDIGVFAARALLDPQEWNGKAIGLAGCEMSFEDVRATFQDVVKKELPIYWAVVAKGVLWWVPEAKTSFEWFREFGYRADIEELRRLEPGLQDFKAWLKESSRWHVQ